MKKIEPMVFTVQEIIDLAEFAGLRLQNQASSMDDLEMEIVVTSCPQDGIEEDDGTKAHYIKIAYYEEYPEEGAYPLGPKINHPEE